MSLITKFIGQSSVVQSLNEILSARKHAEENGKTFFYRPLLFSGLTGLGKTELSGRYAECLGVQILVLPANAGWTEFSKLAGKLASVNEETGEWTGIPSVILIDEAHSQKVLADIIKVLFNDGKGRNTISRNGTMYYYDSSVHQVIFASNRTLDAAISGRCYKLQLSPYTKAEKKKLISLMMADNGQTITDDALEVLESRVKPTGREIKDMVYPFSLSCKTEINADDALNKAKDKGFFRLGLRAIDLKIMLRLAEGATTTSVLKYVAQDDKKRDSQEKIDWLIALDLVQETRGGFALTSAGKAYLDNLNQEQKAAKAAKAAKPAQEPAKAIQEPAKTKVVQEPAKNRIDLIRSMVKATR